MIHLNAIDLFLEEQQHFASLVGNCGRKIRRFLQYYFRQGEARFTLTSEHQHPIQFAHNVSLMHRAAKMAQNLPDIADLGNIAFSVENIDVAQGTMQVVVRVYTMPEGVKARQLLSEHVAFGLRRFQAMGILNPPASDIETFLQTVVGAEDATEPLDTSKYRAQFDKLLASDFSELDSTSAYAVTLAGYLNPAVAEEVERREAEYEREISAALTEAFRCQPKRPLANYFSR